MAELHVFDFDGTIFHSPSPSPRLTCRYERRKRPPGEVCHSYQGGLGNYRNGDPSRYVGSNGGALDEYEDVPLVKLLSTPVSSGGYGWFQSLSTLSPPVVPEEPPIAQWYISEALARLTSIVESKEGDQTAASVARAAPVVCVLTGRDENYRPRIEQLLRHAGVLKHMAGVYMKPTPTAHTVPYKLDVFFDLIGRHSPSTVFYYEDREQQGQRILYGMWTLFEQVLQLYRQSAPCGAGAKPRFPDILLYMLRDEGVVSPCKAGEVGTYWSHFVTKMPVEWETADRPSLKKDYAIEAWVQNKLSAGSCASAIRSWRVPERFILVLVPQLLEKSSTILSEETEEELVRQLKREQAAEGAQR